MTQVSSAERHGSKIKVWANGPDAAAEVALRLIEEHEFIKSAQATGGHFEYKVAVSNGRAYRAKKEAVNREALAAVNKLQAGDTR